MTGCRHPRSGTYPHDVQTVQWSTFTIQVVVVRARASHSLLQAARAINSSSALMAAFPDGLQVVVINRLIAEADVATGGIASKVMAKYCAHCLCEGATLRCSRCGTNYCKPLHQRYHWDYIHKRTCRLVAASASAAGHRHGSQARGASAGAGSAPGTGTGGSVGANKAKQ
jgi:hypothetical protein